MNVTTEQVIEQAKHHALHAGSHHPTLITNTEVGSGLLILEDLPKTHDEKMLVMMAAGNTLRKGGQAGKYLFKVYLITEAWMSEYKDKKAYEKGDFVAPSQDPNRVECLMITSLEMAKEEKNEGFMFKMIRNKEGKLVNLEDYTKPGNLTLKNPLLKAFFAGFYKGDELNLDDKIQMGAIDLKHR